MGLFEIFPPADDMNIGALMFMMAIYGYVLMKSSALIGDGSEMLMLLYGPGIVGGLVIPILGAIPDCAVILISGLGEGTREEIQNQLSVGVGTLVGSTIMLLTIPWGVGVYLGRRDYDAELDCAASTPDRKPKLTHFGLFTNCVTVMSDIALTSKVMLASLLTYCVIQIPSFAFQADRDGGVAHEHPWALACLIFSAVSFCAYCYSQVKGAEASELDRRKQEQMRREVWQKSLQHQFKEKEHQAAIFRLYDKDGSGFIEANELSAALEHLGLKCGRKDVYELMSAIDVGSIVDGDAGMSDGKVSLAEFEAAVATWVSAGQKASNLSETKEARAGRKSAANTPNRKTQVYGSVNSSASSSSSAAVVDVAAPHGDDEEEEEEEEQYWELTEDELKLKACLLLLLGTVCVTIFSDPMVDVITQVGDRLSISPFYVAFVVTPLASNASEVYAGLLFARKKTNESISMTMATLHGAATMNSTLALSIFMGIIYMRSLEWDYTAETAAVMFVVIVVALQGIWRRNIFLWQACIVIALYPLSILIVYGLKQINGVK